MAQLRAALAERGLETSGLKAVLVARLAAAEATEEPAEAAEAAATPGPAAAAPRWQGAQHQHHLPPAERMLAMGPVRVAIALALAEVGPPKHRELRSNYSAEWRAAVETHGEEGALRMRVQIAPVGHSRVALTKLRMLGPEWRETIDYLLEDEIGTNVTAADVFVGKHVLVLRHLVTIPDATVRVSAGHFLLGDEWRGGRGSGDFLETMNSECRETDEAWNPYDFEEWDIHTNEMMTFETAWKPGFGPLVFAVSGLTLIGDEGARLELYGTSVTVRVAADNIEILGMQLINTVQGRTALPAATATARASRARVTRESRRALQPPMPYCACLLENGRRVRDPFGPGYEAFAVDELAEMVRMHGAWRGRRWAGGWRSCSRSMRRCRTAWASARRAASCRCSCLGACLRKRAPIRSGRARGPASRSWPARGSGSRTWTATPACTSGAARMR